MGGVDVLYGVGATKAGTSWFYRYLHDRHDTGLKSLKELHYWDTFEVELCEKQIEVQERRIETFTKLRGQALVAGQNWRASNLQRQISDAFGLKDVLKSNREDDRAYKEYLMKDIGEARLVADITPNYGLLDVPTMQRMVASYSTSRVLFLVRDPVERLWSHVRMQAVRQRQPGEEIPIKAERILDRIITSEKETHILKRGDYSTISERLERAVPEDRQMTAFIEDIWAGPGLGSVCRFLRLPDQPTRQRPVHEGVRVELSDVNRKRAAKFLAPQYEWAVERFGYLPDAWRKNVSEL
ncbi:sulfotransferase family protein [Aestuariibius insulae]|uniref:sulfotransferase family protein n=1 Tax=Aestuariibius insulae TaxID=2058287 RepID=UPI00345EFB8D